MGSGVLVVVPAFWGTQAVPTRSEQVMRYAFSSISYVRIECQTRSLGREQCDLLPNPKGIIRPLDIGCQGGQASCQA